ncbi:hypothetical protein [Microcoleus sp. K4-C2]|uniref:hypothetical protein n=1 Tax=Microcoleus sp. K4-C2 TaxID=2818792 RepID=UPI002FCEA838
MAIELSGITFPEKGDLVVGVSGEEEILNNGFANTLTGKDLTLGNSENSINSTPTRISGFYNSGTFNASDGNGLIVAAADYGDLIPDTYEYTVSGIHNTGTLNTGEDNDLIVGIRYQGRYRSSDRDSNGIFNEGGTIDTGGGDDIITGIAQGFLSVGIEHGSNNPNLQSPIVIKTGNGNDTIAGTGEYMGLRFGSINGSIIDTGEGDDVITGTGGYSGTILYSSFLNTGEGNDTITGISTQGDAIANSSTINTGDGNDIITGTSTYGVAISNTGTINTGDGNDIITGIRTDFRFGGTIANEGIINTGKGADSIITDSGFASLGNIFLGKGTDYIRGSGSATFYGGKDRDSLELTSGNYTVEILGTTVGFRSSNGTMKTSEFEELIAGRTTYDFSSLTNGQTISVA